MRGETYRQRFRSLDVDMNETPRELGGVPGSGLCENPVFVNPEMRETLSYPFQKER